MANIDILLNHRDWHVRHATAKAFEGKKDIPLEWIKRLLNDVDPDVRRVAVKAFADREVPSKWIEQAVNDDDSTVRQAAIEYIINSELDK